jgi:carboxylate-amine ligase
MLRSGAILDKGMVYWDVRLSEHQPTVEVRVTDVAARAEDAAVLAVLVRGLVERAASSALAPDMPDTVLRANLWCASHRGLRGAGLHPVTGELVPFVTQLADLVELLALGADAEFVCEGLASLRSSGGGADLQRAAFARRDRLSDVVDELTLVRSS